MKRVGVDGGFFLCLFLNLIFSFGWTIPAWVALVMHFAVGLPLIWFFGLLVGWFVVVFIITLALSFIVSIPTNSPRPQTPEERAALREEIREKSRNITKN